MLTRGGQHLHIILDELRCPDTSLHVEADVDFNFSLLVCEFYYWYLQRFNLKNYALVYNILHSQASKRFPCCAEKFSKIIHKRGSENMSPRF